MATELFAPYSDRFFNELIQSYLQNPRFIRRDWLTERIDEALASSDRRFLLLTAAPGAGKTAFMAWLADQHPDWPRYFIRRDQFRPLSDPGAHSLLLQIGFQLAVSRPTLFNKEEVRLVVEQRIRAIGTEGQAIGAEIDEILASPFYSTIVQVRQDVEDNNGSLIGARIGRLITEPRLSLGNLQFMALIDPAKVLLRHSPDELLVILIDALDELRYAHPPPHDEEEPRNRGAESTILNWLVSCPELPSNVRFVLTSRPDEALLSSFRAAQRPWLKEIELTPIEPDLIHDLHAYALRLSEGQAVKEAMERAEKKREDFVHQAVQKASGNMGYLDAIGRAMDQALLQQDQRTLTRLFNVTELPDSLEELYAFFLHRLKENVEDRSIEVEDKQGEVHYLRLWPSVYRRILGVLLGARVPLNTFQIQRLGAIPGSWEELCTALDALRQFLNCTGEHYYLYHVTLIEFLTASKTQQTAETRDLYLDEREWHRRIGTYYRNWGWEKEMRREQGEDMEHGLLHYGLLYYALHIYLAEQWEWLFEVLDNGQYGHAKIQFDPSTHGYAQDLDLGRQAAMRDGLTVDESIVLLPCLWRYTLLRCTLASRAGRYPLAAFKLLLLLQQQSETLALVELLTDPTHKAQVMLLIAYNLSEQSDWGPESLRMLERSSEVIYTIEKRDERARLLRELGIALAQAQQWEQTKTIVHSIEIPQWKVSVLSELGTYLLQAQQQERARAVWNEALNVARTSLMDVPRAESLRELGVALARSRQWELAGSVWAEALEAAREIVLVEWRAGALEKLGMALYSTNQWDLAEAVLTEAQEVVRSIQLRYNEVRAYALFDLGTALTWVHQQERAREVWAEAEVVARSIGHRFARAKALRELATALSQTQQSEQAESIWDEVQALVFAYTVGGKAGIDPLHFMSWGSY